MRVDSIISELEKKFPGWKIGNKIGEGSGGKTAAYQIARENFGFTENDVLKIVILLEENISLDRMNEISRRNYEIERDELRRKAEEEVKLMYSLKMCKNIVGYQDFKFLEIFDADYVALVLAIRMFAYQDLNFIAKTKGLSQLDIIKMGIDICSALEVCEKNGIIHRDIKPGNIFCDDDQYLLADFGISRIVEKGDLAHTSQGTPQFAAPEQFANLLGEQGYDHRVDIYSLGLTMYYLANDQKLPFYDRLKNTNLAVKMRLIGNPIEPVEGIHQELNRIMLKACAFSADDRYPDAGRMKFDLWNLYKKVKDQKKIKSFCQTGNEKYETEPLMQEIKNYATDRALQGPGAEELITEQALKMPEMQELRTQRAMSQSETSDFGTERAMRQPEISDFGTAKALRTSETEEFSTVRAFAERETEAFRTERALQTPETENFKTERVLESGGSLRVDTGSNQKDAAFLDEELGMSVASIDTADIPIKVETEESCGHEASEYASSEQDIRKIAASEMKAGNEERAFQWYATLAEKEGWELMYHDVAKLFEGEKDILKRPQDAVFWFTKCVACCKDSWTISLAEFQLGEMYAKGTGVRKNHKIAEEYYRSSAAKGNPYAKKKFVAGRYIK